jgi:hypothetical protein
MQSADTALVGFAPAIIESPSDAQLQVNLGCS